MKLREAAQQALEAIELHLQWHESGCVYLEPAVTALRAALAEDAMQRLTDVQQEMKATINEMETVEPVARMIRGNAK
jgi:exonuclease VII small subunit